MFVIRGEIIDNVTNPVLRGETGHPLTIPGFLGLLLEPSYVMICWRFPWTPADQSLHLNTSMVHVSNDVLSQNVHLGFGGKSS